MGCCYKNTNFFIISLAVRENVPSFDDLTSILMQGEERRKNVENKHYSIDLVFMAKDNKTLKGNPWVKSK